MAYTPVPQVECERHHTNLPVTAPLAAADFYVKKLGFQQDFTWGDPPTLAAVSLGGAQVFLSQGTPVPQGCSIYFVIGNVDEFFEFHRTQGVEIVSAPEDKPWELREYTIRDLHGYALTFGQYVPSSVPPLQITRVDVPVRLEKRLAALLVDLAAHKRMSLSSCLEEILLHTCEPLGDGVASPHTKQTLRVIAELKQKHGIDYDCHASYRFVEQE
jgi:catechol 2,3-dioxygenase-like lactoylglutathione lyase family enzyme